MNKKTVTPSGYPEPIYNHLRKSLQLLLPGTDAQEELAIVDRGIFKTTPPHAKKAAVCAVLYPNRKKINLVFIQRTWDDKDRHSGQISFPGGQHEASDITMQQTAIRELKEETGIQINTNQILGELSSLYIPVSNFHVFPFVVGLHEQPEVFKQDDEVAEIFGFKVERLLNMKIDKKQIVGQGFFIKSAPYFNLDGKTLWGATAMITNELLTVIKSRDLKKYFT